MWRLHSRLAVVAIVLALVGAALYAGASVAADDERRWSRVRELPVNEGAGDLSDISAHNSPTVARDARSPRRLAVSSRIDSPQFSCALHVSSDGGERWRRIAVPIPPGEERKCYAPDVAFAPDGTLHVAYVTLRGPGNVPNAVWLASARSRGGTLSRPVRVSGARAFQVRLAADPRDPRRLHLTWVQAREVGPLRFAAAGNPVVAARSDDAGRTWRRPVPISARGRARVLAPVPAVGRDGELYVLYLDVGGDRLDYEGGHDGLGGPPHRGRFSLVLGRSRDGRTWEESVVDSRIVPTERFVAFVPPFPALAVDRNRGRLYAGFHDGRRGRSDVLVWALDRGTTRWRGPARIDADEDPRPRDRTTQRLVQLAVGPDGRLDALYHDRRADPRDVRTGISLQSSADGARTFGPRVAVSSTAFDSRIGFGSERGMADLGSRLGLVSDRSGALAVWSDTRDGTDASNKQDLLGATLSVNTSAGAVAATLRDAGVALALGGLVALGIALGRRRRPRTGR